MKKSTTKVSKQVNGLSNAEYAKLLLAVAEYRGNIKSSQKRADNLRYNRIFTEPRLNGLRSKYWAASGSTSSVVAKYVKSNPTITVGKKLYSVTIKTGMSNKRGNKDGRSLMQAWFSHPTMSLHVVKVK